MSDRVEVRGRVVDGQGKPVADALIVVVAGTVPVPEIALMTDTGGSFSLRLPPGRFTLRAHAPDDLTGDANVEVPLRTGEFVITVGA